MSKILKYIFVLWCTNGAISDLCAITKNEVTLPASTSQTDSIKPQQTSTIRGIQYDASSDSLLLKQKEIPLLAGFSVSGDIVGFIMATTSSYGQYEGAFRINLKGKFFPIIEIGLGKSNHTDVSTNLHYKTKAPFFRIGCDYNFARNLRGGGRILGGLRYGFSSFKYNLNGPDLKDPIWGFSVPFSYQELSGNTHWAEVVFGLEAKIWNFFRLGWNIRYRLRLHDKESIVGRPWYVPGYGKDDNHAISGTFNIVFDI